MTPPPLPDSVTSIAVPLEPEENLGVSYSLGIVGISIQQFLVQWKRLTKDRATWESLEEFKRTWR